MYIHKPEGTLAITDNVYTIDCVLIGNYAALRNAVLVRQYYIRMGYSLETRVCFTIIYYSLQYRLHSEYTHTQLLRSIHNDDNYNVQHRTLLSVSLASVVYVYRGLTINCELEQYI